MLNYYFIIICLLNLFNVFLSLKGCYLGHGVSIRERRAGEQLASQPAASCSSARTHRSRERRLVAPLRPLHRHAGRRQDAPHLADERLARRRLPARALQGVRRSLRFHSFYLMGKGYLRRKCTVLVRVYPLLIAGTTHALRLDWSTDGTFLVSAHAMNNGGPTAQLVLHSRFLERLPQIYTKALRATLPNGVGGAGDVASGGSAKSSARAGQKRKRTQQQRRGRGGRSAAASLEQENERWLRAVDFAGHRKAISLVRFLPTLLKSSHSECAPPASPALPIIPLSNFKSFTIVPIYTGLLCPGFSIFNSIFNTKFIVHFAFSNYAL